MKIKNLLLAASAIFLLVGCNFDEGAGSSGGVGSTDKSVKFRVEKTNKANQPEKCLEVTLFFVDK